jgi:hypothetical protein
MALPLVPTTRGQRLVQALGPEHRLIRFRTYREYPTEEQARWRIIELLDVGFRPRRVAALLAIRPVVVYAWNRRFKEAGGMSAFLLDGFGQFILQNPLKYLFPPHFPPLLRRSGR